MALTGYLPLVGAVTVGLFVAAAPYVGPLDRLLTRIALTFSRYVDDDPERRRMLESAYVDTTYRVYAAKSYLYAAITAIVGSVIGVYLTGGTLLALPFVAAKLAELPSVMGDVLGARDLVIPLEGNEVLVVVLAGGVVIGIVAAIVTYALRWELPAGHAEVRRRGINEALPRTVAFMYALSRGGMSIPDVMRTLGDNREIYGDAADEVSVAVRQMDLFGTDVVSAVQRMAYRSPSEKFRTFGENLASVLQSGRDLAAFFEDQYDRYQAEAKQRQEEVLELLATIAEAYVTVLVAGVLFMITILLVFGLTTTDTLWMLRLMIYVMVPTANLGFVVYLMQKLEELGISRESGVESLEETDSTTPAPTVPTTNTDGGVSRRTERNFAMLRLYDRVKSLKRILRTPLQTLLWQPTRVFYVVVPVALAWIALRGPDAFQASGVNVRLLDDVVIQATLLVLGSFAIVREYYRRRIDRIESATPEMLERLASLNEAGMSFVPSLDRVRKSDLGALTDEVNRIWADVTMGANAGDALVRFGKRVRTASVARVVTLLTNAMHASGKMGPVLRIAAEQARSDLRMRRQRRQQMLTYLVVVYISFFVFLVIIVAVLVVLIPSLPESVPEPQNTARIAIEVEQFTRIGKVDKAAYALVFFHAAIVQAVFSGLISGQLGEGTLKDGAKHAAIMLTIAYVAFLLLSAPVASVVFAPDAVGIDRQTVEFESVSMSEGGYVVVHERSQFGDVIGRSEYLAPGTHEDVTITLEKRIRQDGTIVAVPHLDSNGDRQFAGTGSGVDPPYPDDRGRVAASRTV